MMTFRVSLAYRRCLVFRWAVLFSGWLVVLSGGAICACAFSGGSMCLCLFRLAYCSFWWVYLCLCLFRWVCVSIPSPVTLLFFPVGLFVPAGRSVLSMAGPLFFPVGLFVLCALSGGSVCLYLLRLRCYSFRWVYLCLWLLRWVCASVPSPVALLFFPVGLFVPAGRSVPSTAGPLFFPVGLFVFQMGGLVTLVGMCIFHGEYVTSWVFKKRECIVRSFS